MNLPRLLIVTDRTQLPEGATLRSQIRDCVAAGATHVVLREGDLSPSHRAGLVEDLHDAGAVVLTARERVIGAAGLHQSSQARGPVHGLVGRSCHQSTDVEAAAADGCRYVTLGPFALTESKPGYGPAIDPSSYADLPIPAYALGGVTPSNARAALAAGAFGIAVMGAIMRSTDPGAVVDELLRSIA